jgi:hypothetical protein
MTLFKIGDQVRRCRAASDPSKSNMSGTITDIIESESGLPAYTMYDIHFALGSVTLYGNQIEASAQRIESTPNGSGRLNASYLP